jgi:hypothetical protein
MALNVIVQVTGTLFGVHAALKMRVVGGPMTIQLSSDPISLSDIWHLIDQQLGTFGLSLPDLSGTPWGAIIARTMITPSLWIAPSGSDPSREAAYLELAFSEPIHIGYSGHYGPIEITIEPDIYVEALFIGYDPGESGISLRAKISTSTPQNGAALLAPTAVGSPGHDKSQIVSYPFPLPAQNSVSAFELKYFGLGQRVGPTAVVTGDDPLATIFNQLETQLIGTDPTDIITRVAKNFYHPDRNWFIAADLIFRGWELRILFNDPAFYGFELTVPPKPPSLFAGLMIEILYQKLGPNLGVYYGALTLPEMMRRIPCEGFILVLPGFSVWIYTNGDFRVNVGWPIGPNSIGILMDVLTGEAGFYFARLRSSDDPGAQSNVDYNPILAFGIGITVYASEGISAGPFSASLSVTVSVTLQGLLAWYAQGDGGTTNILTNQPDHYWFAGTAGISILLQGSIDFAILKASVEVSASIYADIAFETGYGTVVNATASVSVRVSVHVVFFTIHLSFSTTISHQFVVTGPTDKLASIKGPQGAGLSIVGGPPVALHEQARFAAHSLLARFAANRPVPLLRHTALAALGAGGGRPVSISTSSCSRPRSTIHRRAQSR